mgnify:CR=1 FL=1
MSVHDELSGQGIDIDIDDADLLDKVKSPLLPMGKLVADGWHFVLSSSENYAFTPPGHRIALMWGGDNVLRMPRTLRKGENAKALPINNVYMKKRPTMEAATSEFLH